MQTDVIFRVWQKLKLIPGGTFLFTKLLDFVVPYTGSIHPRVLKIERGHTKIELRDHRAVRNHLRSIHAVALSNLGEMSSGLAMLSTFPSNWEGIVVGFSIEFLKKARGTIIAESRVEPPPTLDGKIYEVHSSLRNSSGEVVANFTAQWKLRAKKS